MTGTKEIRLLLDLQDERDRKLYENVMAFARRHDITDESEALKAFMAYLHFLGVDMNALAAKIKDLQ